MKNKMLNEDLAFYLDTYKVDRMLLNRNLIEAIEAYAQNKAKNQNIISPKCYKNVIKKIEQKEVELKQKRQIIRQLKSELEELGGYHIAAKIIYP